MIPYVLKWPAFLEPHQMKCTYSPNEVYLTAKSLVYKIIYTRFLCIMDLLNARIYTKPIGDSLSLGNGEFKNGPGTLPN